MNKGRLVGIVVVMSAFALVPMYGQKSRASEIQGLLQQLRSADWISRSKAFTQLRAAGVDKSSLEYRSGLTGLLEREHAFLESNKRNGGTPSLGEDYSDYYSELIQVVADLKDPVSVNALVGAIGTGHMAMDRLAYFGASALDGVIGKLRGGEQVERFAAAMVLAEMLTPTNPHRLTDMAPKEEIRQALTGAAADESFEVRAESVQGLTLLAQSGDREALSVIEGLAEDDPYQRDDVYPVRLAARNALAKLKK